MNDLPPAFKYWPSVAQDAFSERLALMRDGNNIPDSEPTPLAIRMQCIAAAEREIDLLKGQAE